jgi:hypothetical protein
MALILLEASLVRNYGWKSYLCKEDDNCSICLDSMNDQHILETKCGHRFCKGCILVAIKEYGVKKCVETNCYKDFEHYKDL